MTRGGFRPDAGRKATGSTPRGFRLSPRACELLDGFAEQLGVTQAEVILRALEALSREQMKPRKQSR